MKPAPAEEAVKIFNELQDVGQFDHDAINRLLWRLQQLVRKSPGDFTVRTALAHALVRLGRRSEALEELGAVSGLKSVSDPVSYLMLASLYGNLGQFEEAKGLLNDLISRKELRQDPVVLGNMAYTAVVSGKISDLPRIAEMGDPLDMAVYQKVSEVLVDAGLDGHFPHHQAIVNSLVGGLQCWSELGLLAEEDDPPIVLDVRYLDTDTRGCLKLQRELTDGLADYYEGEGLPPGVYLPYLLNSLRPMPVAENFVAA